MTAADAIRDALEPALPGWIFQLGQWVDNLGAKASRYAVLKHAGGQPAELVRRPAFTLSLIGQDGGDIEHASKAADAVVELLRETSGDLVFLQPAEPVFMPTSDGRPVFEIAISAITN